MKVTDLPNDEARQAYKAIHAGKIDTAAVLEALGATSVGDRCETHGRDPEICTADRKFRYSAGLPAPMRRCVIVRSFTMPVTK